MTTTPTTPTTPTTLPQDTKLETLAVSLVDSILYDLATRNEIGELIASCDEETLDELTETLEVQALLALYSAAGVPTLTGRGPVTGRIPHDSPIPWLSPARADAARQRRATLAAHRETLVSGLTFRARVAALRKDSAAPVHPGFGPDQEPPVSAAK